MLTHQPIATLCVSLGSPTPTVPIPVFSPMHPFWWARFLPQLPLLSSPLITEMPMSSLLLTH